METASEDKMIHFQSLDYLVRESVLNKTTAVTLTVTLPKIKKGCFGRIKNIPGSFLVTFTIGGEYKNFYCNTISTLEEYEEIRQGVMKELIAYFKTESLIKETNGSNETSNN